MVGVAWEKRVTGLDSDNYGLKGLWEAGGLNRGQEYGCD